MLDTPSRVLRFDDFTLDLGRSMLLRGGEERVLRRQSFDVLRHLAERRGEVASRDELIKAVWTVPPARPEDSVAQCIREIRQALGGDARRIVRTVPGRGYQFAAAVTVIEEAAPASPASAEPAPPAQVSQEIGSRGSAPVPASRQEGHRLLMAGLLIAVLVAAGWLVWQRLQPEPPAILTVMAMPTIAVLPFATAEDDPDLGGEARVFADEILHDVGRSTIGSLITLKSAAGYRGRTTDAKVIGRELDARYLLLGSLRRQGDERSGDARLVEAETGHELWTKPFRYASAERSLRATDIADGISGRVLTVESQRPLPARLEAGHYAILAFASLGSYAKPAANKEALAFSEKALELDPDSVPALLTYAWAQVNLSRPSNSDPARLDKAQDAVERAMKIAPRDAMAYARYGQVLQARGDPAGALAAYQLAVRLHPNLAIAHAQIGRHKIDVGLAHEAIAHIREATRLSPTHRWYSAWCLWAGQAAVHMGNHDEAVEWLQKGMFADFPHWALKPWLAVALAGAGREEEGRTLMEQYFRDAGVFTIARWRKEFPLRSGIVAEQRQRIEGLLRRLGVPEAEKGPDAAKRETAEKTGDPKLAAARKPDRPAERGAFDGTWQVRRVGPGCRPADVTFVIHVIEGAVSGHRAWGSISGTVTSSGRIAFKHLSSMGDGVSLRYSATLEGASGSGTFEYPDSPCRGTITLRRGGSRAEPTKDW